MSRTRRYVPALDGVRAVAVVGVLLFHGGEPAVRGGFLGVDAFFVLSGYLIAARTGG
jgi:peptidoglycan/LPS O-acetylase OafA/YrhL